MKNKKGGISNVSKQFDFANYVFGVGWFDSRSLFVFVMDLVLGGRGFTKEH